MLLRDYGGNATSTTDENITFFFFVEFSVEFTIIKITTTLSNICMLRCSRDCRSIHSF